MAQDPDRMNAMSQNHSDFAARVKRIEKGAKSQTLYVGVDEVYQVKRREKRVQLTAGQRFFRKAAVPFAAVMALALGAVSVAAGRVAVFQIRGMPDPQASPDIEMLEQCFIGFGLAMVVGSLLGLRSGRGTVMSLLGAVLGVMLFHNAVHLYPGFFEVVTSLDWVHQILAHTSYPSLLWRGAPITL